MLSTSPEAYQIFGKILSFGNLVGFCCLLVPAVLVDVEVGVGDGVREGGGGDKV